MKKTLLITWGTGYIGSHAVVAFEQAWYTTVLVDNLCNSSREALIWIKNILWYTPDFYECDLRNKNVLEDIFKKYSFDWVLHFAWLKAVGESCEKPLEYYDNNIIWSLKLFECMDQYSVRNIIFSSSATVYDPINFSWNTWVKETASTGDTSNPYGTTKFLLEKILYDLARFSDFSVMQLRYFNPIWAHESGELWEFPLGKPNNLFPYIFKVLTGELEYVEVFWDDYETVDGSGVRDYIDINDLVNAHLLAYEKFLDNKAVYKEYNVGTGEWKSVLQVIDTIEKTLNKKVTKKIIKRREWDIAECFCDVTKIESELWFKAEVSLEQSIENSWNFYHK